jgi:polyphosphate glucokinase
MVTSPKLSVLVVDIGGSRVKLFSSASGETASFKSGATLGPSELMRHVRELTSPWEYELVSIGYPGETGPEGATDEPRNLADGWVGFDFAAAFSRPVRVVNDAAMQALGAYDGGRMLFLGLGTGLGSTLIADHVIVPLDLGRVRHSSGETYAARLGESGLARMGAAAWQLTVQEACVHLREACLADHVLLGGGHASLVDPLPERARRGGNEDAFAGGVRLWEEWVEHHDAPPSNIWRVVW